MSMLMLLPDEIVCEILSPQWLDLLEVAKVDSAFCSKINRNSFLDILTMIKLQTERTDREFKLNMIHWIGLRNLMISHLTICFHEAMVNTIYKLNSSHIIGLNLLFSSYTKAFLPFINSCSNLKYLDIDGGSGYFLHDIRPEILNQLKELAVNNYWLSDEESNEQLDRNEFMVIVSHCSSLHKISDGMFSWCGASIDDFILLLSKFPLLKQIKSLDLGNENNSILRHVAKYSVNLEVLDINLFSLNNDDTLTCICNMIPKLTKLQYVSIGCCENFDPDSDSNELTIIFEYINKATKTIYLDAIIEANKSELCQVQRFLSEFGNFTEISLANSSESKDYEISSSLVRRIVQNNKNTLENLNLNTCISSSTCYDYSLIFEQCKCLRVLEIQYSELSDAEYYTVFLIPTELVVLRIAHCAHCISQRSVLSLLENSPNLKELHLDYRFKVMDNEDMISEILKNRGGELVFEND